MNELKELIKIFSSLKNEKQMTQFFEEIFTEKERKDLAARWLLMKEIHREVPQRKIAEQFHMSLCKITRGAKVLHMEGSISKKILDKALLKGDGHSDSV